MAENNQGMVETMTDAISKAVEKLSSRKVGIALVGMWLISNTTELESRSFIFWLCIVALATQMVQDVVEILWTGKDLPETNGKTPIMKDELEDVEPLMELPPKEG